MHCRMHTYNCLRVPAGCYFVYCYNFAERQHEVYILKIGRDRQKLIFAI